MKTAWLIGFVALVLCSVVLGCSVRLHEDETTGTNAAALAIDDSYVHMADASAVPSTRQALIQYIWGTSTIPDAGPDYIDGGVRPPNDADHCFGFRTSSTGSDYPNLQSVTKLHFDYPDSPGIQNVAFLLTPTSRRNKLVIVHMGHGALCIDDFDKLIPALVENGYDVLAAVMPCSDQTISSDAVCTNIVGDPHNSMFATLTPSQGHVEKYFLGHIVRSINYFQSHASYTEIDMVGLSGGGWTTTVAAAIDPRIRTSISSSGSKPMFLKQCPTESATCLDGGVALYDGDREQMDVPFYSVAGFSDLYALAGAGAGRRHIRVQLRWDDTVFGQNEYATTDRTSGILRPTLGAATGMTWEQAERAIEHSVQTFLAADVDQGGYRFEIDETLANAPVNRNACTPTGANADCWTKHSVTDSTRVGRILAELDGNRAPLSASDVNTVYAKGLDETLRTDPPSWIVANSAISVVGQPAVLRRSGTGISIFYRDANSAVSQYDTDTGTVFARGGLFNSNPAAVLLGAVPRAVAIGTDGLLWAWDGSAQQVISSADTTTVVGSPAMVTTASTSLDVFAMTPTAPSYYGAGQIHHMRYRASAWTMDMLPGIFRGSPSAIVAAGAIRVYLRGTNNWVNSNNLLYEVSQPIAGGSWTLWALPDLVGPRVAITGNPSAAVKLSTGQPYVVAELEGGGIAMYTIVSGSWQYSTISPPSGTTVTLSPLAEPDGFFVRTSDRRIRYYSFATSAWTDLAGQFD